MIPSPRVGHSLTYTSQSHTLCLFGGASHEQGLMNDLHILNLKTNTWNEIKYVGKGPCCRYEHAAVLINHQLIIFGGSGNETLLNDLWIFDFETESWNEITCTGNVPQPRTLGGLSHFTKVGLEEEVDHKDDDSVCKFKLESVYDYIYLFGGGSNHSKPADESVYCLDMTGFIWSRIETLTSPLPRFGHSLGTIGESIIIFGGMNDTQCFNDVWSFNTKTNHWKRIDVIGQSPLPRASHCSSFINGKLLIAAGFCFFDSSVFDDFWFLDLTDLNGLNEWKQSCDLKFPSRLDSAMCCYKTNDIQCSTDRADSDYGSKDDLTQQQYTVVSFGGMDLKVIYNDLNSYQLSL